MEKALEKIKIAKDSKWVKDGEVVEVNALSIFIDIIWYSKNNKEHVLTKNDFLQQYKPYEVVYEYQYAYMQTDTDAVTTMAFYKDDNEFLEDYYSYKREYQRLDFTKRERK